jgi:hypothetical protein
MRASRDNNRNDNEKGQENETTNQGGDGQNQQSPSAVGTPSTDSGGTVTLSDTTAASDRRGTSEGPLLSRQRVRVDSPSPPSNATSTAGTQPQGEANAAAEDTSSDATGDARRQQRIGRRDGNPRSSETPGASMAETEQSGENEAAGGEENGENETMSSSSAEEVRKWQAWSGQCPPTSRPAARNSPEAGSESGMTTQKRKKLILALEREKDSLAKGEPELKLPTLNLPGREQSATLMNVLRTRGQGKLTEGMDHLRTFQETKGNTEKPQLVAGREIHREAAFDRRLDEAIETQGGTPQISEAGRAQMERILDDFLTGSPPSESGIQKERMDGGVGGEMNADRLEELAKKTPKAATSDSGEAGPSVPPLTMEDYLDMGLAEALQQDPTLNLSEQSSGPAAFVMPERSPELAEEEKGKGKTAGIAEDIDDALHRFPEEHSADREPDVNRGEKEFEPKKKQEGT